MQIDIDVVHFTAPLQLFSPVGVRCSPNSCQPVHLGPGGLPSLPTLPGKGLTGARPQLLLQGLGGMEGIAGAMTKCWGQEQKTSALASIPASDETPPCTPSSLFHQARSLSPYINEDVSRLHHWVYNPVLYVN